MTNEPSPRPWRVDESIGGWKTCVSDANGNPVASCWGGGPTEQQEKAESVAALIVDAVNNADSWRDAYIKARTERNAFLLERDRLRDIVRRMAEFVNDTACFTPSDKDDAQSLLREARAAIGEDKP